MLNELKDKFNYINNLAHQANVELYKLWLSDMLLSWHWWVGIAFTIGPWLVWIKYRKKENTYLLLYAGIVSALLSIILDEIGTTMELWSYPSSVIPLIPPIIPWDLCTIPVGVMLTLQIKPKASPFLKAIIISCIGSFILQPVSHWLGLYDPKGWKHWYSVPISVCIYLISNFVVSRKEFRKL